MKKKGEEEKIKREANEKKKIYLTRKVQKKVTYLI